MIIKRYFRINGFTLNLAVNRGLGNTRKWPKFDFYLLKYKQWSSENWSLLTVTAHIIYVMFQTRTAVFETTRAESV